MEFDRIKLDNMLFHYWESLPAPKISYTEWWYGLVKPVIDKAHRLEWPDEK